MLRKYRKPVALGILLGAMLLLCGCRQNPSETELYARLIGHFAAKGYACGFADVEAEREVPIYNATAWRKLILGDEEVLVYFDESNRADYLADGIEKTDYSFVGRFGLRFVLVYSGQDAAVLEALEAMPQI